MKEIDGDTQTQYFQAIRELELAINNFQLAVRLHLVKAEQLNELQKILDEKKASLKNIASKL